MRRDPCECDGHRAARERAVNAGGTASVPATPGATYLWSKTPGPGAIVGPTNQQSITFTAGSTAVALVLNATVTPVAGSLATGSTTVNVFDMPNANITAPSAVTAGAAYTYSASVPVQSGASFVWSITNGVIQNGAGSQAITFYASTAGPVTLGIVVTNGAGATATGSSSLTAYYMPTAAVGAAATMTSGLTNIASVPTQPGDFYNWSVSGGTLLSGNQSPTLIFVPGAGPTVTVSCLVTNLAGTGLTGTKVITVVPNPVSTITSASNVTAGSTYAFPASVTAQSGMTYAWASSGTGVTASFSSTTANSTTITTTLTGASPASLVIKCRVTNAAGTSSETPKTITVYAAPVPTFTWTVPNLALTTGTGGWTATVPTQTGATYLWWVTGGTVTAGAGTPSVTFTAGAVGTLVVGVTVTNGAGVPLSGTSATVSIYPLPSCSVTAPGAATVSMGGWAASVPYQAGTAYLWTITGGTVTSGATSNAMTFSAGSGTSLTLHCSATNGANMNTQADQVVNLVALPNAGVSAPSAVNAGASFTVSVPSQPGSSFAWVFGGTATAAVLSGAGTNSLTLAAQTPSGASSTLTVAVTVVNAAGTAASSLPLPITVNPQPGPSITALAIVTANSTGLTAQVASQAGATYLWSIAGGSIASGTASSTVTYSAGASGSVTLHCVVTTASAGASLPGTAVVQVASAPGTPIVSGSTMVTSGYQGWTAVVTTRPGMTYLWTVAGGLINSPGGSAGLLGTDGTQNSITYSANSSPTTGTIVISCVEINAAGAVSSPGSLSVTVAAPPATPIITAQHPVTEGLGGFTASVAGRA